LNRTLGQIESLEESIKKRSKKLLDYDAARSKANKLTAKGSAQDPKLIKQREVESQTRIAFESLHNEIVAAMPKLNQARQAILGEVSTRFRDVNNRLAIDMDQKFQDLRVPKSNARGRNVEEIVAGSLESIKKLQIVTK
jgi:hypothetical protein